MSEAKYFCGLNLSLKYLLFWGAVGGAIAGATNSLSRHSREAKESRQIERSMADHLAFKWVYPQASQSLLWIEKNDEGREAYAEELLTMIKAKKPKGRNEFDGLWTRENIIELFNERSAEIATIRMIMATPDGVEWLWIPKDPKTMRAVREKLQPDALSLNLPHMPE